MCFAATRRIAAHIRLKLLLFKIPKPSKLAIAQTQKVLNGILKREAKPYECSLNILYAFKTHAGVYD
jgi:hypothetical protein